jgi:leucyl-tRNA synthetase
VAAKGGKFDLSHRYALSDLDAAKKETYILLNQTIKKVSDDLKRMQFNTCIAAIMEFCGKFNPNQVNDPAFDKHVMGKLIQLIAPMAPHFAEEAWEMFGNKTSVFRSTWPKYDGDAIQFNTVVVAVQVNGKIRAELEVARGTDEAAVKELALASEKVTKYLDGKQVVKVIYIKDKLLSIAAK